MAVTTERLRALDDAVWAPVLRRLRQFARWHRALKVAIIVGSVIGAVGGGMEGAMWPVGGSGGILTVKGAMVCLGAGLAGLGGVLLLLGEDDAVAILDSARTLSREAGGFIDQRDRLQATLAAVTGSADALDARRQERLIAIKRMLETVEAAMLRKQDASSTAQRMLTQAIHSVRKAVDYRGGDFFTVTIFRREDRGAEEGWRMYPIGGVSSDPARLAAGGRSWAFGEGYTGTAWSLASGNPGAEVIEPDTSLPHILQQYPVRDRDPAREALYLSVASIPILIGRDDEVWGVVTATMDRKQVFKREGNTLEAQNVDLMRDIARFAGLLAGLDKLPAYPVLRLRQP